MKGRKLRYVSGEVTIIWQPDLCEHAGVCVKMLPEVYNPKERPWIKTGVATKEQLIKQIEACPSGALTYEINS